jgi:putative spermidine/putrescine transport system substrate-binding protein
MRSLGGRGARVLLAGGMLGAGALSASVAGAYASTAASHKAAAHKPAALKGTITVFSQGDVNVQNLWSNTLIPRYEKSHPGDHIKFVFSTSSSENSVVFDELAASAKAHKNSVYDIVDGAVPAEAAAAKLLAPVTPAEVPLMKEINPDAFKVVNGEATPLRGSEVLIAYNAQAVPNPPTTLNGLLAWIKAHPGQFTYCNPADGGSGSAFVQAVLAKYTPAADNLKMSLGYSPKSEGSWSAGLAELKSLTPDIFQQQYPNSNQGVLTLLASGAVSMGAVWSDQATTALHDGQLPKSIKLMELTPPLAGGPDYLGVPANISATEKALAFQFINWTLQNPQQVGIVRAMNGTPAIEFQYLPKAIAAEFANYSSSPALPYSANTDSDMNSKWQSTVG